MRVFALSDVHVDYESNRRWIENLSAADYQEDVLILAGDVSDMSSLLEWCLSTLARRFRKLLFVPGNHDLWVLRERKHEDSFEKFADVRRIVESSGASMHAFHHAGCSIVPLYGWYDYSFGHPGERLRAAWMDYRACRWPDGYSDAAVAKHFDSLNTERAAANSHTVITFSHFMPRTDLLPAPMTPLRQMLFPILGSTLLERRIRDLKAGIHVYGHHHVNRQKSLEGVTYINNAFGYPDETAITARQLLCIREL